MLLGIVIGLVLGVAGAILVLRRTAEPEPVEEPTDDAEQINAIENAEVRDLVRRFKAAHVELTNSQSKDRATGIFESDRGRLEALIENARGMIEFGESSVDLPENPGDVPAVGG